MSITPSQLPDHLLSHGQHTFTLADARDILGRDDGATRKGIERLAAKRELFSPSRSFYVVVPPEFRQWGTVPAAHFIDDLMSFLDRRYYVALLSAAELHGAAHHAPQVFQVMVDRHLRDRDHGRVRLRFFAGAHVPGAPTERRNTPTGQLTLATRELTAVDLAEHPAAAGGLDNVATVLAELTQLDGALLSEAAVSRPRSTARRLGWLLHAVGADVDLGPLQRLAMVAHGGPTDLHAGGARRGSVDHDWNVRVNAVVEPDL